MAEVPNAALRCDRIQVDIVRLRVHESGALTLEGKTDQTRSAPAMPGTPEGECPIIEPAAHAEATALAVDAHERRDDQIEPARGDGVAARGAVRNADPEHAAARLAGQRVEAQARVAPALDDRDVDAHSPPSRGDQQCGGIRLPIERQIDRHPGSRLEGGQAGDGGGGEIRPQGVIGRGESASPGAQVLAQLAFHGGIDGHDLGDGATRMCRFGPLLPT